MVRLCVLPWFVLVIVLPSLAVAAPVKQQPIPPATVLGQHLSAVVGALDEGQQPEGRYFVFLRVDENSKNDDGSWSSTVSVYNAQYKPPREDVAAAIGKMLIATAAGAAVSGAAVNVGASVSDAADLGGDIAMGGTTANEDMLPATFFLDDSGHDSVVDGYLPAGVLVAVWLEFGPDGTAVPVVDSSLGDLRGPHPFLVDKKMDVKDVYAVMQRLKLPNSTDETIRQYEKVEKQLAKAGEDVPQEIDTAFTMLDGSNSAVQKIHERFLREQLDRGTHAAADHVALGRLLVENDLHEEALAQFVAAIALDGERPDLDLERATCLYMLRRDEEAWALLESPLASGVTLAVHLCNQIAARSGYDISRCSSGEHDELPW